MKWFVFDTQKGGAAVLMEGNTLCRLLLPAADTPADKLQAELEKPADIEVVSVPDSDDSVPLIHKIKAYYRGTCIEDWEVDLDLSMLPPFYRKALQCVFAIPYGQTRTYGEIAAAAGSPKAARAVGQANRSNPIPLVIP